MQQYIFVKNIRIKFLPILVIAYFLISPVTFLLVTASRETKRYRDYKKDRGTTILITIHFGDIFQTCSTFQLKNEQIQVTNAVLHDIKVS